MQFLFLFCRYLFLLFSLFFHVQFSSSFSSPCFFCFFLPLFRLVIYSGVFLDTSSIYTIFLLWYIVVWYCRCYVRYEQKLLNRLFYVDNDWMYFCWRATRGRPPLPFFENRKKCSDLGKNGPDFVHLWVKFSIRNVVLRVSKRKNSKIFPCGAFFSCVFNEMFIKVP